MAEPLVVESWTVIVIGVVGWRWWRWLEMVVMKREGGEVMLRCCSWQLTESWQLKESWQLTESNHP